VVENLGIGWHDYSARASLADPSRVPTAGFVVLSVG
jgi:hypothetical protein